MDDEGGFDCLGAEDTTSFTDFLKKQGVNLMSATAEQLGKGDKKPEVKKDVKKPSGSMMPFAVGALGGGVAGAALWKAHRVFGGLGGALGGGILGRLLGSFLG